MAQGRFVWYDLATTDLPAAQRFYGDVIGWRAVDAGHPTTPYTLLQSPAVDGPNAMAAGMMAMSKEMCNAGAPVHWGGYVHVDDVDSATARLQRLGGSVHRPPTDIPHVGRFSVVSDPQGASFYLFTPSGSGEQPPESTHGFVGWRELRSTDPKAALAFYSELVGWKAEQAFDMGPAGAYQLFRSAPDQRGGIMRGDQSAWLYYFSVPSASAALTACKGAGGQIVDDVHQEPEGGWIARCRDPQGALFAVASRQR